VRRMTIVVRLLEEEDKGSGVAGAMEELPKEAERLLARREPESEVEP